MGLTERHLFENDDVPENFCGNTDDRKRPEWCPLKEQEAKEQCLKIKCVICPHCDNCDVDENGLLKEQEPVYGSYGKLRCGTCRALINSNDKFCSACGRKIKW